MRTQVFIQFLFRFYFVPVLGDCFSKFWFQILKQIVFFSRCLEVKFSNGKSSHCRADLDPTSITGLTFKIFDKQMNYHSNLMPADPN